MFTKKIINPLIVRDQNFENDKRTAIHALACHCNACINYMTFNEWVSFSNCGLDSIRLFEVYKII